MATKGTKKKADPIPECPYGARCYRKNPAHLSEFSHPKKIKPAGDVGTDTVDSAAASTSPSTSQTKRFVPKLASVDDSDLPACKYGAKCFRKNLMHFAEFSHPTKVIKYVQKDVDDSDTDELDDDHMVLKPGLKKDAKSMDILKTGMSLVKSYTAMTEDERKELIKRAFEAKRQLEEELKKTKDEVKKKEQEVEKLQKEVATGLLLMDGEKEALEGKETKFFDLVAERTYKEGSAAQTHFRLAESQFYRLLSGSPNFRITKVEYVVNPTFSAHFKKCRENLEKTRGEEFSYPVLGFHGTKEEYITPICKEGFKVPGESGHAHRTDTGWYGKGVYFSEYPAYSMSYIQGKTKLLLCQVLPGKRVDQYIQGKTKLLLCQVLPSKIFNCTQLIHGASLQKGFDSHTSPDKKELVIFNAYHILPSYVVHYKSTAALGEFKYEEKKDKTAKGKGTKKVEVSEDMFVDDDVVVDRKNQALAAKKGKGMQSQMVTFSGEFALTQKEMIELAMKHGATKGTSDVFNLLIASESDYDNLPNKVTTAQANGTPIVHECYMYDSIINGEPQDVDYYEHF